MLIVEESMHVVFGEADHRIPKTAADDFECDEFKSVLNQNESIHIDTQSYGDLSPSNRGRLLKMVAAPSRHVFDEAIYVNFTCIFFCFKNVLGIV